MEYVHFDCFHATKDQYIRRRTIRLFFLLTQFLRIPIPIRDKTTKTFLRGGECARDSTDVGIPRAPFWKLSDMAFEACAYEVCERIVRKIIRVLLVMVDKDQLEKPYMLRMT